MLCRGLKVLIYVSCMGSAIAFSSVVPSNVLETMTCSKLRRSAPSDWKMISSGSLLVTYGDIWKELKPAAKINPQIRRRFRKARAQSFQPRAMALRTLNVVGTAAANLWSWFLKGPTDDEVKQSLKIPLCWLYLIILSLQIRANLKRWATTRGGAVLPPLEDHELNNQVKYMGLFPELVEQMLETHLDQHEEVRL